MERQMKALKISFLIYTLGILTTYLTETVLESRGIDNKL